MDKLKVIIDGVEKKIEFSVRICKGIFVAGENKMVLNNCKCLKIDLAPPTSELEHHQKFTKVDKLVILTTRVMNQHFQYMIMDYAEPEDLNNFIREVHPMDKEALLTAYNLAKVKTLADLNLLGTTFGNKN